MSSENVGRDAGLYEGDMRLTIDQAILIESAGDDDILDVRGSITTGKWPGAVLAYEIESSLSKLFSDFSLRRKNKLLHTNEFRVIVLFHR